MRDELSVRNENPNRVKSAETWSGKQCGDFNVGVRFRIRDLPEQDLLRVGESDAAGDGREFQDWCEKFPETAPVRWVVHLGRGEVFWSSVSLERNLLDEICDDGVRGMAVDFGVVV